MVHRRRGDVIAKKATIIAVTNQKGGTGKTTTCENLGIGLAMEGKKVLLVDADPQGSLTISMGWQQPDELPTTLSTLMAKAMNDQPIQPGEGVLHHAEGVDLIPANIELAGLEVSLVNCMNREKMLKQVLEGAKYDYDFILLDCTPWRSFMSEKLDKLRATLKKEQERRIKLNNCIAVLERRIQEEEAAEVSSMVRTANVTPEQLAALLRQSATATPNPAALSAVGATFEKEVDADED